MTDRCSESKTCFCKMYDLKVGTFFNSRTRLALVEPREATFSLRKDLTTELNLLERLIDEPGRFQSETQGRLASLTQQDTDGGGLTQSQGYANNAILNPLDFQPELIAEKIGDLSAILQRASVNGAM